MTDPPRGTEASSGCMQSTADGVIVITFGVTAGRSMAAVVRLANLTQGPLARLTSEARTTRDALQLFPFFSGSTRHNYGGPAAPPRGLWRNSKGVSLNG
jgi:hypothetical protein